MERWNSGLENATNKTFILSYCSCCRVVVMDVIMAMNEASFSFIGLVSIDVCPLLITC